MTPAGHGKRRAADPIAGERIQALFSPGAILARRFDRSLYRSPPPSLTVEYVFKMGTLALSSGRIFGCQGVSTAAFRTRFSPRLAPGEYRTDISIISEPGMEEYRACAVRVYRRRSFSPRWIRKGLLTSDSGVVSFWDDADSKAIGERLPMGVYDAYYDHLDRSRTAGSVQSRHAGWKAYVMRFVNSGAPASLFFAYSSPGTFPLYWGTHGSNVYDEFVLLLEPEYNPRAKAP